MVYFFYCIVDGRMLEMHKKYFPNGKDNYLLMNREPRRYFGKSYQFIIDVFNSEVSFCDIVIKSIHHIEYVPNHLKEILDLIHPDDLPYLLEAETWIFNQYKNLTISCNELNASYCFRMKTSEEKYEMFYHETTSILDEHN